MDTTLIDNIRQRRDLTQQELQEVLTLRDEEMLKYLFAQAREVLYEVYGKHVFLRGLVEVSSYCRNDCHYCGLRRSNADAQRYRLTPEQILDCCKAGYELGFRTFVLQGGEDGWFTDERLVPIVSTLHEQFPDCAITLSLGERSHESYLALYNAGARRYLLRHETANRAHYGLLHPQEMSFDNRQRCLQDLKAIGYQVGCGFMVGSPGQTVSTLYEDLQYIRTLQPQMVGIGPFIPAEGTPFAVAHPGSPDVTLRLLALIRLLHPHVLLPATTALESLLPNGRELGLMAGANVLMPNLSPSDCRAKYAIYNHKAATGLESAEGANNLRNRLKNIGLDGSPNRGDFS